YVSEYDMYSMYHTVGMTRAMTENEKFHNK
ncbi:MAG: hypothetical protein ACI8RD_006620, partial [Bacillariaceae sp.]